MPRRCVEAPSIRIQTAWRVGILQGRTEEERRVLDDGGGEVAVASKVQSNDVVGRTGKLGPGVQSSRNIQVTS
jgi:hypothetical protein